MQYPFLKNAGIRTSSSRTKTSVERALQEQLAAEQVRSAGLIEQVDQLKSKTEKIEREFEEFKKQQRESTISSMSISCSSALVTLSLLDVVNMCGLFAGLM